MQIPESWLRSMADPPIASEELAQLLTMSGLEVESATPVAPDFSGVVVARVLAVDKHPNADKLAVCKVDSGGEVHTVVCGAPNVRVGMKVPLAKVGAQLPDEGAAAPVTIQKVKMRGVESQGMLCSARELGMSDDHAGLLELGEDTPVGRDLRSVLSLDDRVLSLKLTPNRADCLSVLGVAREVSALARTPLKAPATAPVPATIEARHPVRISAPEGCGRFTSRVIRNVNAQASTPDWMKQRLARAGQRSISALVDVTNYVMLELGRPLHVYDLDKLHGPIDVRFGRPGEKVRLLNEQEVAVDESVLCITDESGVIGLAGIMGGDSTKADAQTRHVLLESAFFYPEAIAGRARRFGFTSDASHRFERGVDFDNNVAGIERATQLVLEICGGEPGPTADNIASLPERKPVTLRLERAGKVIGLSISEQQIADIFRRLGLPFHNEKGAFVVTPPSYRFDLQIEEDLIEEVARVYGYARIPARLPVVPAAMTPVPEARRSLHAVRDRLAALDYSEVINFSFVSPQWESDFAGEQQPLRLLNPIASQLSVMRTTLLGSLVGNIAYNVARKLSRVRVFEIGRVFLRDPSVRDGPLTVAGVHQPMRVAGAAYGSAFEVQWAQEQRAVDFYDVKGDVEALLAPLEARFEAGSHPALHPGRSARVMVQGRTIGWVGELHPEWVRKYELAGPAVVFELEAEALQHRPQPSYRELSKFPQVRRDIAVEVDEKHPVQALLDAMAAQKPPIVDRITVFDTYRGKGVGRGKKSLAFRVLLQDTQKTLTDAEVDAAVARLRMVLEQQYDAKLRQ
jgi:phenylalanyl-tRNA synthetase beta chain